VVVADVSGKGIAAALIMAMFRAALRLEARRADLVTDVVEQVNMLLLDSIDPSRYVTAVYGILDPASGTFDYVNCGHNPPMLLRADGSRALLDRGRPALGMPIRGSREAGAVQLAPGDLLAIYTDGVVEPFAPGGNEFGEARLEALLRRNADQPASRMVRTAFDETLAYAARRSHEDDFTLLVIKRTDAGLG
jgi:serine phosphatase RsbU (regulator of sigma subunit)